MKTVGIIGATGYAGAELFRLLSMHPGVKVSALSSVSFTGKALSDVYSAFHSFGEDTLVTKEEVFDSCEVVFASLPHGLSQDLAHESLKKGRIFIDLGADFRLESAEAYESWYDSEYRYEDIHKMAVYGLPELNRAAIKETRIVANPGCYPTSAALGLYPLLKAGAVDPFSIIVDAKSGVTGAGRSLTQNTHFPELNESFAPYKVAAHRHTPEIEETLSKMAGEEVVITFVPHLLPLNRGIISTIYAKKRQELSLKEAHALYAEAYRDEPFVRLRKLGDTANLKDVRLSNYCDLSLHEDPRTGRFIIVSAIDNMVKGAAGQAIQNMNLILGLDERMGLDFIPPAF